MRSSTETLVKALRILARDIQSDDGVANAAIAEAADRLAELERENAALRDDKERLDSGTILLIVHGERVHHVGVNLRDAIDAARKEAKL